MNTFKEKYLPYALESERKTGISAVFILAQAALETGWGKYAPGNMFFGVKATKTTPPEKKQLLRTKEVLACPTPTKEGLFPEIISITKRADGKYLYIVRDWFKKYESNALQE